MLILIGVIAIIMCLVGICRDWDDDTISFFRGVFVIDLVIIAFVLIFYPFHIDEKIEMYQEENASIETKVKETVRAYMDFEQDTYKNLIETADLTTLILKYPELNSNELVKAEIETYKENNAKIKELKEEKINKKTMSWWLYFGGGKQ